MGTTNMRIQRMVKIDLLGCGSLYELQPSLVGEV